MPVIYKIFLFLLLKQGLSNKTDNAVPVSFYNNSYFAMPIFTTLYIEGDETMLEEAINLCQFPAPDIIEKRYMQTSSTSNAIMVFKELTDESKRSLTQQLIRQMAGRIRIEWKEIN